MGRVVASAALALALASCSRSSPAPATPHLTITQGQTETAEQYVERLRVDYTDTCKTSGAKQVQVRTVDKTGASDDKLYRC